MLLDAVGAEHLAAAAVVAAAGLGLLAGRMSAVRERQLLRYAAWHDPLTGLVNRAGWQRNAEPTVIRARRCGRSVAIGLVDLDGLKQFNDRFGHAAGDTALWTLARRLADHLAEGGLAARLGGDEFAVVLVGPADAGPGWLTGAVHDLHQRLCRPVRLAGVARPLTVSVGVAAAHDDDLDAALLQADVALYRAKRARSHDPDNRDALRGQVAVYTRSSHHPMAVRQRGGDDGSLPWGGGWR